LLEATEVKLNDLDATQIKIVKQLISIFGKYDQIFDGIHGVVITFPSKQYGFRIDKNDVVKLSKLPIRWLESSDNSFSVGF
jgi:hypothetical protein